MSEICIGGMVLETNMSEILVHVDAQTKLEKSETSPTSAIKVSMEGYSIYIVDLCTCRDVPTLVGGGYLPPLRPSSLYCALNNK